MYACMKQLPAASELKHVADAFELAHQSINFLVDRKVEYKPQGRYQTAEAAASIHGTIVNYLTPGTSPTPWSSRRPARRH